MGSPVEDLDGVSQLASAWREYVLMIGQDNESDVRQITMNMYHGPFDVP